MLLAINQTASYSCGNLGISFSGTFPYIIHTIIVLIKVVVPILLIIFGMLDLGKAVIASKEDEIKKGQQTFIKRIIAALIVFFVIQIVQLLVKFASSSDVDIINCMNCFINAKVDDNSCIEVG